MTLIHKELLLIVLIIILCGKSLEIIELEYNTLSGGGQIELMIGTQLFPLTIPVSLTIPFTWIPSSSYRNSFSSTRNQLYRNTTIIINENEAKAQEYQDSIEIVEGPTLRYFNYLYLEVDDKAFKKGGIGLGTNQTTHRTSFLSQLKRNNLIESMSFGFSSIKIFRGKLFLGGLPMIYQDTKYHGYCNVSNIKGLWDCKMKQVIIGDVAFDNNYLAYFDHTFSCIRAPKAFITFLYDSFFKKQFDMKNCQYVDVGYRKHIRCKKTYALTMGIMKFQFDNHLYSLDIDDYFSCFFDSCDLYILENVYRDEWIFNSLFIEKYNVSFNYDTKQVHFYSNDIIEYVTSSTLNISFKRKALMIVSILMSLIGIIMLLSMKSRWVSWVELFKR